MSDATRYLVVVVCRSGPNQQPSASVGPFPDDGEWRDGLMSDAYNNLAFEVRTEYGCEGWAGVWEVLRAEGRRFAFQPWIDGKTGGRVFVRDAA